MKASEGCGSCTSRRDIRLNGLAPLALPVEQISCPTGSFAKFVSSPRAKNILLVPSRLGKNLWVS
jgi:hypothetical protein